MATDVKRTIKISGAAYQAVSRQAKKTGKSMEDVATAILSDALSVAPRSTGGEQYGPDGKRIFRRS